VPAAHALAKLRRVNGTVSVALCTRDGAEHLEEQLLSILAQSHAVDELVVSDDASSDDTIAIVRRVFGEQQSAGATPLPRLRLLQNATALGVTKNFERALVACTGEFIALCDQDDVWHPDRVSTALSFFEDSPGLDLVHADARLVDENGQPLGPTLFDALDMTAHEAATIHSGNGFAALLRRNLVTGATVMVRKTLVSRAAPFPLPWVHDEWLAVIAGATAQFDFVPEQLIDYRQHSHNQIGVRKLGFVGKVGRIFEPRGQRNAYLLERALVLLDRLAAMGDAVPAGNLKLAREKVDHLRARNAFVSRRTRRWIAVFREVRTGRYHEFSRGRGDVLRDLLQRADNRPARKP
jgi:glycosyltransferase involved in cell wall biosynthesis